MVLQLSATQFARLVRAEAVGFNAVYDILVGSAVLSMYWSRVTYNFTQQSAAIQYLRPLYADATDGPRIRDVLRTANGGGAAVSDSTTIERAAASLVGGKVWMMPVPVLVPSASDFGPLGDGISDRINLAIGNTVNKIDFGQISKWEGGQFRIGYIPSEGGTTISSSGMTIGSGLDLGQQSISGLTQMLMLSPELASCYYSPLMPAPAGCQAPVKLDVLDRCLPYIGTKFSGNNASQATAKVANAGPVPWLSESEANSVDYAYLTTAAQTLRDAWNSYTESNPNFLSLTGSRQTALLSIRIRTGALGGDSGTYSYKNGFLQAAAAGNWSEAATQYRSWKTFAAAGARAVTEANMLQ